MKKTTLQYLVNLMNENIALNGGEEESQEEYVAARDELVAELSKGQARKDATVSAYAEMWKAVRQALADATAPVTAQEIADETGLSRGKIVYGLGHSWANEVVKDTSGKSTTYVLKA
jgi:response regulator of citrate/malate metabolism